MKIRLNKVQKELNLGLSTIVEFLQKKGFEIKEDPNAVVPEDGYNMLIEEFSADKKARMQSDNLTKERQNKEKPKAAVVEEKTIEKAPEAKAEEPKATVVAEEPKKEEFTLKVKGHIDLDALNKKSQPKKKEAAPAKEQPKAKPAAEKPVEKQPAEQPVAPKTEVVSEPAKKEPQAQLTQIEEVETPKLNIIGQIDLSAINQSTRPKKKSKEEKRKEREEKDKQREEQRKQQRETQRQQAGGEGGDKKKKRQRINSQRVDINDVKENNKNEDKGWNGNRNKNENNPSQGSRKDRDRQHKRFDKNDVSDEDVSKQIKETLDRLTNRGKGNKSAKYRKEKRDLVAERQMQQISEEMEQSKVLKLTERTDAG